MAAFERVYVDASVIVRRTLNQPGALQRLEWGSALSSELVIVEVLRVLDRLRVTERPSDEQYARLREVAEANLAAIDMVPLDRTVLTRAGGAWPAPLKTLDAIHLATAMLCAEYLGKIVLLTHDRQLATAARACGLAVHP